MSRISNIETAILGLVCEKPRYGYEIEKVIEERQMRNWTEIGFSSIYYVLNRLEKYGHIKSKFKSIPGKPARKIYSVTPKGKDAMVETIKDILSTNVKPYLSFDLGMAYMKFLTPKDVTKCLDLYLDSLAKRLNHLEERMAIAKKIKLPINIIALFTRPITLIKAEKKWVEKFKKDYLKDPKSKSGEEN